MATTMQKFRILRVVLGIVLRCTHAELADSGIWLITFEVLRGILSKWYSHDQNSNGYHYAKIQNSQSGPWYSFKM